MKGKHLFFAFGAMVVTCLVFSLMFLSLSGFFIESLRSNLCDLMLSTPGIFLVISLVLLVLGFFFLAGFYFLYNRKRMRLKMKSFPCEMDIVVIEKYLSQFFKSNFPYRSFRLDVLGLPRGRLEIVAYLHDLKQEEKNILLNLCQNDLAEFLKEKFGYEKPFFISLYPG
jgi:hypothetical protein